jgi:GrpB-like predicted nucleotidyltransferase (UPF0157 family)
VIWCGPPTIASLTCRLLARSRSVGFRVVCIAIYTIATVELIGEVEKREIELVPPDPAWPERFAVERAKIVAALGAKAIRVDHIGSTSIPGLAAKPIIDIDLSIKDADHEEDYLPDLIAAGYQLRVREPGHRMMRSPNLGVHVHCCTTDSDWERRHLLFRDWLRYDQADRVAYGELKNELAQQDWTDMTAYAEAKSALIREITARAERWAVDSSWSVIQVRS